MDAEPSQYEEGERVATLLREIDDALGELMRESDPGIINDIRRDINRMENELRDIEDERRGR